MIDKLKKKSMWVTTKWWQKSQILHKTPQFNQTHNSKNDTSK